MNHFYIKINMKNFKIIKSCRCCKNKNLIKILNLKNQPLANLYHDGSTLQEQYPLFLNLCPKCFHSQLSVAVNPDLMFKNYLYVSGTSNTLNQYFNWFTEMVEKTCIKQGSVLDIACNDGTQLKKFKLNGWKTVGIDPAINLFEKSKLNADQIIVDYFNLNSIKKINLKHFDAIIAQNVFAHTDDVESFLLTCKELMNESSKLYIQTSQADMIENNQFDTIYHEHLSFFSTKSIKILVERLGLKLLSIYRTPIHGTSYIFVIGKSGNIDDSVQKSLIQEEKSGRYDLKTYKKYKNNVNKIIKNFQNTIQNYKNKGYLIVGYGAAAKGNTFLNASNVKLHYVIDDNEEKQNLLLPGTNTLIVNKKFIKTLANNTLFVPLAWNFYNEIKNTLNSEINSLSFKNNFNYKIYSYYPEKRI